MGEKDLYSTILSLLYFLFILLELSSNVEDINIR